MTSERKIRANRANSRTSTGAKTADGKRRSARNTLRHALSLPVHSDPMLSEAVETLARQIADADSNPALQPLARHIAEAQIDLCRVRHARYQLLSEALKHPYFASSAHTHRKTAVLRSLMRAGAAKLPLMGQMPEEPQKFAIIFAQKIEQFFAIDRYERRALSRRKFAIRAFHEAQRTSD